MSSAWVTLGVCRSCGRGPACCSLFAVSLACVAVRSRDRLACLAAIRSAAAPACARTSARRFSLLTSAAHRLWSTPRHALCSRSTASPLAAASLAFAAVRSHDCLACLSAMRCAAATACARTSVRRLSFLASSARRLQITPRHALCSRSTASHLAAAALTAPSVQTAPVTAAALPTARTSRLCRRAPTMGGGGGGKSLGAPAMFW